MPLQRLFASFVDVDSTLAVPGWRDAAQALTGVYCQRNADTTPPVTDSGSEGRYGARGLGLISVWHWRNRDPVALVADGYSLMLPNVSAVGDNQVASVDAVWFNPIGVG